jgi:hypothetical protein
MKIYLEWLEIPCIGVYSGLSRSNLVFGNWMHEKYFLLVQVFWLLKLGSKHKGCMKQTNIYVIENNHANFLESTNDFNLRILILMSQSRRKAEMMYLQTLPSFSTQNLKVLLLLTKLSLPRPTRFTHAPKVIPILINKTNHIRKISN